MQNLRRLLENNPMEVVWPVVIFAATFAIGWLIRAAMLRALRAFAARKQSRAGRVLSDALRGPMLIWCVILGVHIALQFSDLPAKYTGWAARGLLALWIFSLTIMFMRVAGELVRNYGDQVPGALPVTTLSESLAKVTVLILGLLLLALWIFSLTIMFMRVAGEL